MIRLDNSPCFGLSSSHANHLQLTVVSTIDVGSAWKGESISRSVISNSMEYASTEMQKREERISSMALVSLIGPIERFDGPFGMNEEI